MPSELFRVITIGDFDGKPLRHTRSLSTKESADEYVKDCERRGRRVESIEYFRRDGELSKPTAKQITSACLSYRHDYGVLSPEEQKMVRFEAVEWLRAWQKEEVL